MATIAQIKEAAIAKGFKFQIDYPRSYVTFFRNFVIHDTTEDCIVVRFSKDGYVWYNFGSIGFDDMEQEYAFRFERYPQTTGKSCKSFNQKLKALAMLGL